jgi:hypothetical protein
MAALAAEAATRQSAAGVSKAAAEHVGAESAERIASHRRPRPARSRGRQLSLRLHPAMGAALLIVFLIVGFGYVLSRSNSSSSSSSSALSEGAVSASAAPSQANGVSGAEPAAVPSPSVPDSRKAASRQVPPFTVIASGRNYTAAGLAAQVQGEVHQVVTGLNGTAASSPAPSTQVSGSSYAASAAGGAVPSPALIGCVQQLAGSAPLDLVELASYQGRPVYIIATATRAWVVGRTCTAANPAVIAEVTLSAAP